MGVDGRLHGGDGICSLPRCADNGAASRALNLLVHCMLMGNEL